MVSSVLLCYCVTVTPILHSVPFNMRGTVDETRCRYCAFCVMLQSLLRFTKSLPMIFLLYICLHHVLTFALPSNRRIKKESCYAVVTRDLSGSFV